MIPVGTSANKLATCDTCDHCACVEHKTPQPAHTAAVPAPAQAQAPAAAMVVQKCSARLQHDWQQQQVMWMVVAVVAHS